MTASLQDKLKNTYLESHSRFMRYFIRLPTFKETSMRELEDELPNLRLAFEWALEKGDRELLSEFWNGMKDFLMQRGLWNIFLNWGKATLIALPENEVITRAWLLSDLGWLAMEQSDYPKALDLFEQARLTFNSIDYYEPDPTDHQEGICAIERYLGVVHYRMGNYELATQYYATALSLAEQNNFFGMIAETHNLQGSLARKLGDYSEARKHYKTALTLMNSLDKKWNVTAILRNLARLEAQMGNYEEALTGFQQAINLCRELDRKDMLFGCQVGLAEIKFEIGNVEEARQLAIEAREGFAELGMMLGIERSQNLINKIDNSRLRGLGAT